MTTEQQRRVTQGRGAIIRLDAGSEFLRLWEGRFVESSDEHKLGHLIGKTYGEVAKSHTLESVGYAR